MIEQDSYTTHQQALIRACLIPIGGAVIEFGCGYYSTPLLHEICEHQRRQLISLEDDLDWVNVFLHLASDLHIFVTCSDGFEQVYNNILKDVFIGMAFLDHNFYDRRMKDLILLKDRARIIVCHDFDNKEHFSENAVQMFKHIHRYSTIPETVILSNFVVV